MAVVLWLVQSGANCVILVLPEEQEVRQDPGTYGDSRGTVRTRITEQFFCLM